MNEEVKDTRPRGIRNNNPGNMRFNEHIAWRGQTGQDEDGFVVFKAPEFGIRAMALELLHYNRYLGLNTVHGFISRWAPPSENDTGAYVEDVCTQMGVSPFTTLDIHTQGTALIKAIIMHENGEVPYSDEEIAQGVHLSHAW